jgi:lysophospholipase L1-like esterase
VTLLLSSVALALLVAELGLRLFGVSYPSFLRPDPITGWAHPPGAAGWFTLEGKGYVRINAAGFRGADWPVTKPPGVTRIAVLGDSYTEGVQVAEDSTFSAVLERELNAGGTGRYEVLNFGVGGFGTGQELIALRRYVFAYMPDVVILAFLTSNDVSDNSPTLKQGSDFPFFRDADGSLALDTTFLRSPRYRASMSWRARLLRFVGRHSRLAQLARRDWQAWNQARIVASGKHSAAPPGARPQELSVQFEVYLDPPPDTAWANAWTITERLITQMSHDCQARDIAFFLVTLSNPPQVTPDSARLHDLAASLGVRDLLQPERRLERLSAREGFGMLALAPLLSAAAIAHREYYHGFGTLLGRGHWNARGHQAAAALLRAWLAPRLRPR